MFLTLQELKRNNDNVLQSRYQGSKDIDTSIKIHIDYLHLDNLQYPCDPSSVHGIRHSIITQW
jgi:hypothetical protein